MPRPDTLEDRGLSHEEVVAMAVDQWLRERDLALLSAVREVMKACGGTMEPQGVAQVIRAEWKRLDDQALEYA